MWRNESLPWVPKQLVAAINMLRLHFNKDTMATVQATSPKIKAKHINTLVAIT